MKSRHLACRLPAAAHFRIIVLGVLATIPRGLLTPQCRLLRPFAKQVRPKPRRRLVTVFKDSIAKFNLHAVRAPYKLGCARSTHAFEATLFAWPKPLYMSSLRAIPFERCKGRRAPDSICVIE